MSSSFYRSITLFSALAVATSAVAEVDSALIDRIITEGKYHSQVMPRLTYLCKQIGARLTGSPRLAKAQQWAMSEFKRFGLKNIHLDKWGETPVGWDRTGVQVARMVEPFESEMVFTTTTWGNGTKGIVSGEVVMAPTTAEELAQVKNRLKGAWVLFPGNLGGRGATTSTIPTEVSDAIDASVIAGRIYGSRTELVLTSGSWSGKTYEKHPGVTRVTVRKSDFDRLSRNINFGRRVVVEIGSEASWYKGPVPQYNVVADIPGTEKPDEYVIVSGHFDSWNGPGSEGALDNGTGSITAMEAARILMKVGAKPKRTIRFILWSGEEQGIYGSSGYVKNHPDELSKISAVLVDDGGTGYQAGYDCIASQKTILEEAFAPVAKAFPDLPMKTRVREKMPQGGGSDHAPFNRVGVPGFFTIEGGDHDYNYIHHTQHDVLEEARPNYLVQSATNHAVVAFTLACLPELLPREAPRTPSPANP